MAGFLSPWKNTIYFIRRYFCLVHYPGGIKENHTLHVLCVANTCITKYTSYMFSHHGPGIYLHNEVSSCAFPNCSVHSLVSRSAAVEGKVLPYCPEGCAEPAAKLPDPSALGSEDRGPLHFHEFNFALRGRDVFFSSSESLFRLRPSFEPKPEQAQMDVKKDVVSCLQIWATFNSIFSWIPCTWCKAFYLYWIFLLLLRLLMAWGTRPALVYPPRLVDSVDNLCEVRRTRKEESSKRVWYLSVHPSFPRSVFCLDPAKRRHRVVATLCPAMLPASGKTRQQICALRGHNKLFLNIFRNNVCVQDTNGVSGTNVAHVAKRVNIWETWSR